MFFTSLGTKMCHCVVPMGSGSITPTVVRFYCWWIHWISCLVLSRRALTAQSSSSFWCFFCLLCHLIACYTYIFHCSCCSVKILDLQVLLHILTTTKKCYGKHVLTHVQKMCLPAVRDEPAAATPTSKPRTHVTYLILQDTVVFVRCLQVIF